MPVTITATRTTQLNLFGNDQDGDNFVDLGDTLFIRLDIANSGNEDALNVVINDALLGQTLVDGSINFSPLAVNDVFNAVGNTQLIVGGATSSFGGPTASFAGSITSNDSNIAGNSVLGINLTPQGGTSLQGGFFSIEANGSFVYRPALNFVGTDSFNYTVSDNAGLTSTAKVTINVSSPVWYVDTNYAGVNGGSDGSSWRPFTSMAPLNGAGGAGNSDGANSTIYVQGNHTADIVLETGQSLIGTGAALVVNGFTLATAGTANTFTHSTGTGVLLATDNTIRGITINGNNANGVGIADNNGAVGNLTISATSITGSGQAIDIDQGGNLNVALGTLTSTGASATGGGDGAGVQLSGAAGSGLTGTFTATGGNIGGAANAGFQLGNGAPAGATTLAVNYGGTLTNNGTELFVYDRGAGAGDLNFSGVMTHNLAGTGVNLTFVRGGNVNLSGELNLTSSAGNGVQVTSQTGGTINLSGANSDLSSAVAAISVGGMTGGTLNFSGQTLAATGTTGGRGISLVNNDAGAINFSGGALNAIGSGAGGTAFQFNNSNVNSTATLTVTGSANAINSNSGAALVDISNGRVGTGGINFGNGIAATTAVSNTGISINNLDKVGTGTFNIGNVFFQNGTTGAASDGIRIQGDSSADFVFQTVTINGTGDEGLEISGATGSVTIAALNNSAAGGSNVSISNNSGAVSINSGALAGAASGQDAVNITGGTGAVTVAATITKTTAGEVVEINNHETGNISFTGTLTGGTSGTPASNGILVVNSNSGTIAFTGQTTLFTGANAGVTLTDNTGGTINFTPSGTGLDITTTTGAAFTATGGGTVSLTGTGNSIAAGNGAGINIQNTNIGAADLTFQSVTSNGGSANGITLINTGSAGGLHITGNGTNIGATGGGVIANKTGADGSTTLGSGIYLSNTAEVELNGVLLQNFSNFGIRGIAVNGFSLTNSTVEGTGVNQNGSNTAFDEGSVFFGAFDYSVNGATGTVVFNNVRVEDGIEGGVNLFNNAGTTNVTVTNSTFQNNGNSGFLLAAGGTNNMTAVFTGSTFADNEAKGLQIQTNASGAMNARVGTNGVPNSGGTFFGNNVGLSLEHNSTGAFTFNVLNATLSNGQGAPVSADVAPLQLNNLTLGSGAFSGNMIGNTVINYAASAGPAVRLVQNSTTNGVLTLNFANNNVTNNAQNIGVQLLARDGNGDVNFTMTGNTITNTDTIFPTNVLQVNAGASSGDTNEVNLDIRSNTFSQPAAAENAGNFDIRLARISTSTGRIEGYTGSATDATAIGNYLAGLNTGVAGNGAGINGVSTGISTTGTGWSNIVAVPMPASPLMVAFLPLAEAAAEGAPASAAAAASQAQAEAPRQGAYFGPGNKFNGIPNALGFSNDAPPMDVVKIYDPVTGKLFDHETGAAAADAERGLTAVAGAAAGGQQTSGAATGAEQTAGAGNSSSATPAAGHQSSGAPGEKGGPDLVQIVAAPTVNPISDDGVLTQAELDYLVDAAIQRWIEAGATEEQVAAMRATKFSAKDLGGLTLGQSNPGVIVLDDNAAGHNWYLDAAPGDDAEFKLVGGALRGAADTIEGTRVDLLTAIMHELGHQIGLEDSYNTADSGTLMYGFVNPGERHLPGEDEVAHADGTPVSNTALALGAINFGTLEAGTTRSISWKTTYDGPGTNRVITDVPNTSTVTYNNGGGPVVVNSTTNTLGTGTFPAVDSLTLGGTIWNDNGAGANKGNGVRDAGEAGINGVTMALFVDANNDNVADTPGTSIATATTAGSGNYSFINLAPGNYIVRVDQTNFNAGGPLVGAQTSSVTTPEPVDPDNDVDNDDNGARSSGNPAFSYALALDYNSEPTTEDGDADTNFTLDFGFLTPNAAPTFASPSAQPTYNENAAFVVVAPSVTVADENASFAGGTVSIALTSGGTAGDVVGIATSTTPNVGIEINGGTGAVSYNGVVIGTAVSATSVTLNAAATAAAIQALAQAVIFTSSSDNPTATPRVLTFTFNDGGGTASGGVSTTNFTRTITVVPSDDLPTAFADAYATDENVILNVAAGSGVLFNDTDPDAGPKTVASINGVGANVGAAVTLASGAKVTVNADGSLSYDPNGAYNYLVPAGSGAVNTSAVDSFTYALNGGSSTTVNVTVNGVAGPGDQLRGTPGADTITGTTGNDAFRLQQGGDDIANGGNGDDGFYFGAAFTGADQVDGGAGTNDQIGLQGNYAALALTSAMIANVEVIALLSGANTAFGDTANNFYDYNITVGAGVTAANNRLTIQGTSLRVGEDFTFNGSASGIDFIAYGGLGVDNLTGGSGNDGFYFGEGRFSSSDIVNGGAGTNDQLGLDGNYGSAGTPFELSGANINGIEVVALLQFTGAPLKTYFISTNNSLVGAGQNLTIWALPTQTGVTVDGSAETDGRFTFFGGAGADRFTGGTGGDSLTGGGGADTFAYTSANQSTGFNFDQLIGFDDNADKIDLPGGVASFAGPATGSLSLMSFNADLAAGVNAALGPNQAIVFTANGGDLAGRIFGVVDANGDGNYTAGTDFVFEFVAPVTPIDQVGMFI